MDISTAIKRLETLSAGNKSWAPHAATNQQDVDLRHDAKAIDLVLSVNADLLEIAKELAASARLPSGVSYSSRRVTYPAGTLHKLRAAISRAEAPPIAGGGE